MRVLVVDDEKLIRDELTEHRAVSQKASLEF